jgi:hypothetical protein
MQAIGIQDRTLTKEEQYQLGTLLLKAGYQVSIRDREVNGKKLRCIYYGIEEDNDGK